MALIESWVKCELSRAVQVQYLQGNLFSADNQGNLVGVRVFENGEPASLSGSVSANVIRADGTTVPVAGTLTNGNECYVILPQAAYAVTGVVTIVIKITASSVVTTLAAIVSTVYASTTDAIVDPGTIIPSIETLIAAIEAAVATIPADYSSLWATVAPAYTNVTFPVKKGQYCTYNGHMYRAKQDISSSESFTSSHWEACNIGTELFNQIGADTQAISDLKSALYTILPENLSSNYVLNYYISVSSSTVAGDTVDLTPTSGSGMGYQIIYCAKGDYFEIAGRSVTGAKGMIFVDNDNKYVTGSGIIYETTFTAPQAGKLILNINTRNIYYAYKGKNLIDVININIGENSAPFLLPNVENGMWTVNGGSSGASSYRRTPNSLFFKQGTSFIIYAYTPGSSGTTAALITEWSSNDVFIQTLVGQSSATDGTEYTLDHDAYLRFSYRNSDGFSATYFLPSINTAIETGANAQNYAESLEYEWERVLNSVCCIGDSLTKGAYYVNGHDGSAIEQNYPYFFAKQTGLTVQNEGFSGSSPSSRWSYFSAYDFTPYNAFLIWWGTNGGLTDTLYEDGVIDSGGNLIADYTSYSDTNTGDYCKVIGKIIQQVPHAKIFLATIYTTSGNLDTTNEVIGKIATLYPNNVMGVVDCNDGTLYTLASKKLTPSWVHIDNTTHFSMVGNYYLAIHWIKAIRAIIATNPANFENIMEDIIGS